MKTVKGSPFLRNVILITGLMVARGIPAQTFTTLHSFTVGSDGASPYGGLVVSSNTLYGTTYFEFSGTVGVVRGTVFAFSTDGTGFTTLHHFSPFDETTFTNIDGNGPKARLTLSGDTLYGAAAIGGISGGGTVFSLKTDGSEVTILHSFTALSDGHTNSDGYGPECQLVLSGDTLYGTAVVGGSFENGTVFSLKTNGSAFRTLHSFNHPMDYGFPTGGLVLSGNTLYGTAYFGGTNQSGTVFALNTDGTGFTNLHIFTRGEDGGQPQGGLILSGDHLFGTTESGGTSFNGTVFSIKIDGTGFRTLHSFTAVRTNAVGVFTNSDGAVPAGPLTLVGNTLYGTAQGGGSSGAGTVFCLDTDGSKFRVLHSFTVGRLNGPLTGVVLSGNMLYGTTADGGANGNGTIFSIFLQPELLTTRAGSNVVVTWPTNFTGFTLQSTTDLASPIWTPNLPAPVVVNGQNVVTNPISGTPQFFRLSQ